MTTTTVSTFDATSTPLFFKEKTKMALVTRTATAFKEERIEEVADLGEYFKDDLKTIFENFRKPVL